MDTKHFPDDTYIIQLFALYKQKYAHKKFDVIISSDDNAFNFLNYYSEYIFPDTPVVFCGVNYYKPEDISGLPLFTGVNEEADLKAGIEIALKLHPETRRIIFVNDTTTTGKKVQQKVLDVIPEYKDTIRFELLQDYIFRRLKVLKFPIP